MIQTALGPESWYLEGLYLALHQIQQNAYVRTAAGQSLDYIAEERGITRKPATFAKREGVFNQPVSKGDRFSTVNGNSSIVFAALLDSVKQSDGLYHATLVAETAGVIGNTYTGDLLPITFIQRLTDAKLTTILTPGTEEESDDDLRSRFLASLQEQPFAGNIVAYRQEILSMDNVGAVQVYPFWDGGGTVKCCILDANFDKASAGLVEEVQTRICPPESEGGEPSAYGYGFAPIGAKVTIATGTDFPIALSTQVTLQTSYSLSDIQTKITAAFQSYLLSRRKEWGTPFPGTSNKYSVPIYISQLNAAILGIDGVVNVTATKLNGSAQDLQLTETGTLQQIPVAGEVVVTSG